MSKPYEELLAHLKEALTLSVVVQTLHWDQETMMPERAAGLRAEELSLLSRMVHERLTGPEVGEWIEACHADSALMSDPDAAANLREMQRDFERGRKIPAELVAELTETGSRAMEAWKRARQESDFTVFVPWLEKQVELHRRKAECYGYPAGGELYDALLADYEPQITAVDVERIFGPLREALRPLIERVAASGVDPGRFPDKVPIAQQKQVNQFLIEQAGFDVAAGRLDESVHPFSTGLGPGDTRITTRFRDDAFLDTVGSTLHETGHGLYEQGLPAERFGQPLGQTLGLGIHESQSRLWENHVGRSRTFWSWALPHAQRFCAPALDDFSVDDIYGAMNRIEPNLIRVESDEATYHMHIMLRFDLERAMIRGDLAPRDLPGAWNERVRRDLGIEVPDDARGCLQDVHWSMGYIGYFPTYSLGSLYAAQFWKSAEVAIPGLDARIGEGDFAPLLAWLRERIHSQGRRYSADELCRQIAGESLSHEPLIEHLASKIDELYPGV